MKTLQIITLFALIAAAMGFSPNTVPTMVNVDSLSKVVVGALPAAVIASPAFALDSVIDALPNYTRP